MAVKWLQSSRRFQDVAQFYQESGEFTIVNRDSPGCPDQLEGSFDILGGTFMALFSDGATLFIGVGHHTLLVTDEVVVTVEGDPSDRLLVLKRGNAVLKTVQYSVPSEELISGDTTAFIHDEDVDYGLFLSRVYKDKRLQR